MCPGPPRKEGSILTARQSLVTYRRYNVRTVRVCFASSVLVVLGGEVGPAHSPARGTGSQPSGLGGFRYTTWMRTPQRKALLYRIRHSRAVRASESSLASKVHDSHVCRRSAHAIAILCRTVRPRSLWVLASRRHDSTSVSSSCAQERGDPNHCFSFDTSLGCHDMLCAGWRTRGPLGRFGMYRRVWCVFLCTPRGVGLNRHTNIEHSKHGHEIPLCSSWDLLKGVAKVSRSAPLLYQTFPAL